MCANEAMFSFGMILGFADQVSSISIGNQNYFPNTQYAKEQKISWFAQSGAAHPDQDQNDPMLSNTSLSGAIENDSRTRYHFQVPDTGYMTRILSRKRVMLNATVTKSRTIVCLLCLSIELHFRAFYLFNFYKYILNI